jgi:hypothetical protein
MPIRLNLLAEDQAAEEMRRRDPVKRALWLGGLLVAATLVWSGALQLRTLAVNVQLSRLENDIATRTNDFQEVLQMQNRTREIETRLAALHQLATNRFLNGNLLNALQQTVVNDVELTRLKVDQSYVVTEATKDKTSSGGRVIRGKPATCTEKIVLTLEARDHSPNPGDQINPYKQTLAAHPYFQSLLGHTNEVRLVALSAPTTTPEGRTFVQFTLECRLPEVTR